MNLAEKPLPQLGLRAALFLTPLLGLAAVAELSLSALQIRELLRTWNLAAAASQLGAGVILTIVLLGSGAAAAQVFLSRALKQAPAAADQLRLPKPIYLISLVILLFALPILVMGPTGAYLEGFFSRLLVLWLLALLGAELLSPIWPGQPWLYRLAAGAVGLGAAYQIAVFRPDLSTYPLSLGWSEVSRYYYGSLFLSERVYGIQTPPSVLHPTRYLLQAVPFLIDGLPLWAHRFWQVAIWLGLSLLSGSLLARRLSIPSRRTRPLVALWGFLFLFQGPILDHLLVPVVLVLGGFDRARFWRSAAVILLASVWAGISRINWIPVPAFIAATLYFLEMPFSEGDTPFSFEIPALWGYLRAPVLWILVGSLVALGSQSAYVGLSGNATDQFSSSFTSDLLWYRLLPSATYPLGVLPAALIVSLPVLTVSAMYLLKHRRRYHPIRLLGLASMGFVLFAGGVVVSTKIGGGSNLHNIDAFLVLLLINGAYVFFNRFSPDGGRPLETAPIPWGAVAWSVAIPVAYTLLSGGPFTAPDPGRGGEVLAEIKAAAAEARAADQEVLFISERHLVTFDVVENVPLVPEYEKVFLMEMAMSGNPNYLGQFQEDLAAGRFGLIVSHPLRIVYQGRDHQFGEENDAWVTHVSEPVLCYYEPVVTYRDVGVQMLVPRAEPGDCP
jgi:hypothetical protein